MKTLFAAFTLLTLVPSANAGDEVLIASLTSAYRALVAKNIQQARAITEEVIASLPVPTETDDSIFEKSLIRAVNHLHPRASRAYDIEIARIILKKSIELKPASSAFMTYDRCVEDAYNSHNDPRVIDPGVLACTKKSATRLSREECLAARLVVELPPTGKQIAEACKASST